MTSPWTNPFACFLINAEASFRKIQPEIRVHDDLSLVPEFVRIHEERQFVFDIYNRVETLSAALDRLRELWILHTQDAFEWEREKMEQRLRDPQKMFFDTGAIHREMARYVREARAHVAFVYYELATLVSLLKERFRPKPGSHLEYLVGVRNKLLSHPRKHGRIKNSNGAVTFGPILLPHLLGAESWIPLIRDWYLGQLRSLGAELSDDAGEAANIELLRDGNRRVESFHPTEILRLKTYVIPEPKILAAATEMAELLEAHFSEEIERVCTATTTEFRAIS